MCYLLARCLLSHLLRDWILEIRITNVQSLSTLSPIRDWILEIQIANVKSLITLSPKRLGIRMANAQSQVTFWATVE